MDGRFGDRGCPMTDAAIKRRLPKRPECAARRRSHCAGSVWLAVSVMIAAVAAGGCGGCHGRDDASGKWGGMSKEEWLKQYREKREAEDREEAAASKRAEERKQAEKQKRVFAGSTRTYLSQGTLPGMPQSSARGRTQIKEEKRELPPLPALPESFSDWTDRDYVAARITENPALLEALPYFSEHTAGDPDAAELLARVLRPLPARSDDAPAPHRRSRLYGRKTSGDLIEMIVAALGANGTEPARQTLVQLISGQLETEDDRAAALAAIGALVDNPSPENEELLFGILTGAEALRPPARGKVSSDELRKLAFELLQPIATSGFRVRVAQWMVDPATPPESRDKLSELIGRMHPDGLEASAVLLLSDLTPDATKAAIMEEFASYSSRVLGRMLRLPEEPGVFRPGHEWPRRVIGQLWNPDFCDFLEDALGRVVAFEEDVEPVVLAATVPADSVRAALHRTLTRHWTDGPDALASAGLPDDLVGDPGLLLIVQTLVYEEIAGAKRTVPQSSSRRLKSARSMNHLKAAHEAWQGELGDVADDWLEYLEGLQSAMCRRLFVASTRRGGGGFAARLSADSVPALSRLPFELHTDARVIATYHLDWSPEVQQAFSSLIVDPMEVCYARIEEETRLSKMLGTYRRRLKTCSQREIEDGFVLESLHAGSQPGRKRCAAVRVIRAMPEIPRLPNQDQPLTVEILSIEMNDPSDPRWRTASLTEN